MSKGIVVLLLLVIIVGFLWYHFYYQNPVSQYTLTISTSGTGTVDNLGTHTYDAGSIVTITATSGTLGNWTDNGSYHTETPIQVTMNSNHVVVIYFGASESSNNFDIIVLPDTQHYASTYPSIFDSQTQWIVNSVANLRIVFVSHEGDVVNTMTTTSEWQRANSSMSRLDGHVPWGILPGNHDLGIPLGLPASTTTFNTYFGMSRFSDQSWYGGCDSGDNANNYELLTEGTAKFLILHLQFDPGTAILNWASSIVQSYPDRRIILDTHDFLNMDGSRTAKGTTIWNDFVSLHTDQIFLVLCGHVHGEASRTDTVNGHTVHQILADYQDYANGGNGYLRILNFHPVENMIYISTYSPYLNQYETDSNSQFTIGY
jgi:hypothetical protein